LFEEVVIGFDDHHFLIGGVVHVLTLLLDSTTHRKVNILILMPWLLRVENPSLLVVVEDVQSFPTWIHHQVLGVVGLNVLIYILR
jgi:hypothetical protein